MTKTTKELFEVYRPKSPDEQKFVDKHVVIKHKDRSGVVAPGSKGVPDEGNGDDVFKATNIKPVNREPTHGYNPGNDEKVYEEVEITDAELVDDKEAQEWAAGLKKTPKSDDITFFRKEGKIHAYLGGKHLGSYTLKSIEENKFPMRQVLLTPERETMRRTKAAVRAARTQAAERLAARVKEKQAQGPNEEYEAIDEMAPPGKKAEDWKMFGQEESKDSVPEYPKTPEEREARRKAIRDKVPDLVRSGRYPAPEADILARRAPVDPPPRAPKSISDSKIYTKNDIIEKAIGTYVKEQQKPLALDEQLLVKIAHIPERDAEILYTLFDGLNEENKKIMLQTVDTVEGLNGLIDFAIENVKRTQKYNLEDEEQD